MSDTVRDAVFGNVGTMITFRVSADDSPILAKQFEPQFEPNDLLQMHNRNFIINMVINGEKSPAFSAKTLNLPPAQVDNTGRIIQHTRDNYSRSRADIEKDIDERIMPPENLTVKKPGPAYTPPKDPAVREAERRAKEAAMLKQGKTWPISNVTPDQVNTALNAAKSGQPNRPRIIRSDDSTLATTGDTPTERQNTPQAAQQPVQQLQPSTDNQSADKPKRRRSRNRKRGSGNGNGGNNNGTPSAPSGGTSTPQQPKREEPHDPTVLSLR